MIRAFLTSAVVACGLASAALFAGASVAVARGVGWAAIHADIEATGPVQVHGGHDGYIRRHNHGRRRVNDKDRRRTEGQFWRRRIRHRHGGVTHWHEVDDGRIGRVIGRAAKRHGHRSHRDDDHSRGRDQEEPTGVRERLQHFKDILRGDR
ncbi:MAG: hypothetical protein AAFW46_00890 [Pseudomonadota bacterium]